MGLGSKQTRWSVGIVGFLALVSAPLAAAVDFDDGARLHPDLGLGQFDLGNRPRVATDGSGRWVAVWDGRTVSTCQGFDHDIQVSRSSDGGLSWSFPVALHDDADVDDLSDFAPQMATDGDGVWIAVWHRFPDILISRSEDDGATWSEPQILPDTMEGGRRLETDGQGTWLLVSNEERGTYPLFDDDLVISRSTDNGLTWSTPVPLNADHASDTGLNDFVGDLVYDGQGRWLLGWSRQVTQGAATLDSHNYLMTSDDGGLTWSTPTLMSSPTNEDFDLAPSIALEGSDKLVAVWLYKPSLGGFAKGDVKHARSLDGGATWSEPAFLDPGALLDDADNDTPTVRTDGRGNWVATWASRSPQAGALGTDKDILYSHSANVGLTWSPPQPVNSWATSDNTPYGDDRDDALATDGRGNWVVAWVHDATLQFTTARVPFVQTCASDADGDGFGQPGDAACPLGGAPDCDDTNVMVAPDAPQRCDGLNNDCEHVSWPGLGGTPEADDDGDGLSECASDCNDADAGSEAHPGIAGVLIAGKETDGSMRLEWSAPGSPGGDVASLRYDVLRTPDPLEFRCPTTCVASDTLDTQAFDPEPLASGEIVYYVVRPENGCANPAGRFVDSSGSVRPGRVCR